jgi:hypothetical protein
MGEEWVALGSGEGGGFAFACHLVIPARGALFGGGFFFRLPARFDEFVALEAAERGVDGAAGESGDVHDVEAEAVAEAECLEDESRAVGEAGW